jgi:hypothetical protein
MKRGLLNSSSLAITIPGKDVEAAGLTPADYIFNSNFRAYFNLFLSGAVNVSAFVSEGGGNYYFDVMFGKTFSEPPPALVVFSTDYVLSGYVSPQANADGTGGSGNSVSIAWYTSMVDRLRLQLSLFTAGFPLPTTFTSVYYIVATP